MRLYTLRNSGCVSDCRDKPTSCVTSIHTHDNYSVEHYIRPFTGRYKSCDTVCNSSIEVSVFLPLEEVSVQLGIGLLQYLSA